MFLTNYYLIIVLILPIFFILYSSNSNFFNILRIDIVFDIKKKSSKYILTMLFLLLDRQMRML